MPANTQHPDSEWTRVKPYIEEEYLNKNRSAKAVQVFLREHHNFDTTVRKLKLKFEAWKWDKKTTARNYAAMNRLIPILGTQVVFIVPKMGGRSSTRKEAPKIMKEARRKQHTNEKRAKPSIEIPDDETAWKILEEAGIKIEDSYAGQTQPDPFIIGDTRPAPAWPLQLAYHPNTTGPVQNQAEQSDDDDSSDSDESVVPDADIIADASRELNLENFPPPAHLRQDAEKQTVRSEDAGQQHAVGVLPFESAFVADLHRTIFPHTSEYQLKGPSVGIVHDNRRPYKAPVDPASDAIEFLDFPVMSCGQGYSDAQRAAREKFLADALRVHYQNWDQDGQRRQVLEFSAYYVGQFLAGNETLDDYYHIDRQEARRKLHSMLEHGSTQLLPHCYWLSQVVISFDKSRQLLAFYEDCIDCIETSKSQLARVLQPWIRSVVLLHRDLYKEIATKTVRLSPASLDQLQNSFDATGGFEASIQRLREFNQEESHTCLILRVYHAWYLGHRNQHTEGLRELVECSQLAERIFGKRHLVTINCFAMAARAYEKLNDIPMAENYIQQALHLLTPSSRFLEATYNQLLLRQAKFQIAKGDLEDALRNLELVFAFRLHRFGAQTYPTWEVAKILFEVLNRQGHTHEARRREAELQKLHDNEWQRHPINHVR